MPAYNASTMTPGRRHRVVTKSKNVTDAQTKFVETVGRGVTVLMEERGYSRERATSALLREIARGDNSPPSEDEIFRCMHSHGLSMDAATKALMVSRALQREIQERNISMVEAIDDLTSKLSVTNLVRKESQSTNAAPDSPCEEVVRAPEMRIQPVPAIERAVAEVRQQRAMTTTPTTNNVSTLARKGKQNNSSKTGNNKQKANAGRKRSMEDVVNSSNSGNNTNSNSNNSNSPSADGNGNKSTTARDRSDSVSDEVNAKLLSSGNKVKVADEGSTSTAPSRNANATVRSKRGRVEDTETVQQKRARTNEL